MADPLSIAVSVASIVDFSIKIVGFIRETYQGTRTIDDDVQHLIAEIKQLENVSSLIGEAFEKDTKRSAGKAGSQDATDSIWRAAASALKDCDNVLAQMLSVIEQIAGDEGSSTFDRLRRHFRKLSKDDEIVQLQQKLGRGHQVLQMSLTALNIIETRQSQVGSSQSFAGLSEKMAAWELKLDQLIRSLETNANSDASYDPHEKDGIAIAKSIQKLAWLNDHFMLPQPVSNMFMGRETDLAGLGHALKEKQQDRGTKRVVIYGLGGSGKTQFCCKFAQDNRPSFWAVFFINATNEGTVQSSYADIAGIVGIEPKEGNVKHWLSVQTKPWLLIVDNADDHLRSHPPESFIPECDSGLVIFTTRNHQLRTLAHFVIKFEGLEAGRSSDLLLKSAARTPPYSPSTVKTAIEICGKFGFLPLAILHAGKAILGGVCTLENCLDFLERSLSRVKKIVNYGEPKGNTSSVSNDLDQTFDDPAQQALETLYATFELVIPAASEEASQLLRMLSFMQAQRLHFSILLKAIVSPQRQANADLKASKVIKPRDVRPFKMSRLLRNYARTILGYLEYLGDRPALPAVFNSLKKADPAEAEFRLRAILSELRALSLVDYIEGDDTYSMHSSVNWWIRASMGYKEKAVWCQSASNVLAFAILLPPVGIQDGDVQLRRQTLPHIEYVRAQEAALHRELARKQQRRERSWPDLEHRLGRARLLRDAKFSLVYAECGMWQEAQDLLLVIDRFLSAAVGLDDPVAARARMFLSETYWWLDQADEAVRLQEELLAAVQASFGDQYGDTLNVKTRLGVSYWQKGKYHKARELLLEAVEGYQRLYPTDHVDKSKALSSLGMCVGKCADFDQAIELHLQALNGLLKVQKATDSDLRDQILEVKDHLAMARLDRHRYGRRQKNDLSLAADLQGEVLMEHTEKLGKEHPRTLWARCNLARIRATAGGLEEAEGMLRQGLQVAERTIGPNHIGTLFGRAYLGQVLTLAGKLDEAEEILESVVEKYQARGWQNMHGDHLVAAALLLDCYRRQEKLREADDLEVEVLRGIRDIFGEKSPWENYFVRNYTVESAASS